MFGLEQLPWYVYASIALVVLSLIIYLRKKNYISPDDLVDVKQVIALMLPLIQDEGVKAALTVVLEYLRYETKETQQAKVLELVADKVPEQVKPHVAKLLLKMK
ncbi:MAG: hypothetical protein JHC26_07835 [Thermofilum sp.]|uniref:hypothetical protein n=1 Tax=Thermofilum sp. TaxID=1961369 RepID=UPI00258BA2C0|nr:hypothetical protein [Thermofilum sp.]MCI4408987.1 hypothetical protein [Thermofilum sp.]